MVAISFGSFRLTYCIASFADVLGAKNGGNHAVPLSTSDLQHIRVRHIGVRIAARVELWGRLVEEAPDVATCGRPVSRNEGSFSPDSFGSFWI